MNKEENRNNFQEFGLFFTPGQYPDLLKELNIKENDKYCLSTMTCDYCGKDFDIKDIKIITDSEITSSTKSNFLGAYIERSTKFFKATICKRCNRIHIFMYLFCALLGITFGGLVFYYEYKYYDGYFGDFFCDYVIPVSIAFYVAYFIYRIIWFIIRLLFHVRRKPKK